MALAAAPVSPRAAPLPPLPADDPLSHAQWRTLLAILDTVVPSIAPVSTADADSHISLSDTAFSDTANAVQALAPASVQDAPSAARAYLRERLSTNPDAKLVLQRLFALYMPPSSKRQLCMVLDILNTRAGSLALTGYLAPISTQPPHIREAILQSWALARLGLLRQLHRQFTLLGKVTWIRTSPCLSRILGVPRVPTGMKPGKGFEYEFLQFPPDDTPATIDTDVIIVGSGCGGAVCAKNLAEAGHRVVVVEKSYHWTPEHFPMAERDGWNHLFMNGGAIGSDDLSANVTAGSAWGGGGTVNWSASLQTQSFVRQEWADQGLLLFTSAEFQDCLDRVCQRMGVSNEHIQHNKPNQILMEGARKLGLSHIAVPQNTGGQQHNCGHCTMGCGSCEKQGPVVSFLPDAARAGAQFIEGFHAENLLFNANKRGPKTAAGITGTWTSRDSQGGVAGSPLVCRKIIINAARVIVSAGTMQSPLFLLRSGLTNPQIGRNLHIHPVSPLGAFFPAPTNPWDGPILTAAVTSHENLDGRGHGVKLEAHTMLPSFWLTLLPWLNGAQYKAQTARFKHMAGYISLCRDRDSGRVYPDPDTGGVRFQYDISRFDKQHILEGLVALAKILYVGGASEIFTVIPGMRPFIRADASTSKNDDGINDPSFQDWLADLRAHGFPAPQSFFLSAHQMSTCRMSASEKTGVIDEKGKVWGTSGVWVADASTFPSASGVNPMVTCMAIAEWISMGIVKEMKEERGAVHGEGERARL